MHGAVPSPLTGTIINTYAVIITRNEFRLTFSKFTQIPIRCTDEILVVHPAFLITRLPARAALAIYPTRVLLILQGLRTTLVVRTTALGKERSPAVALEVGSLEERAVDRELVVVGSETVACSIGVSEETRLENGIRRGFNVGNHVCRGEGQLVEEISIGLHAT